MACTVWNVWPTKWSIHIPCAWRRDGSILRAREIWATVVSHMTNIYSELKIWTMDIWPLCLLLSGSKISHNCSLKGEKAEHMFCWSHSLVASYSEAFRGTWMSSSGNIMAQGLLVKTLIHWPQKPHSPGTSSPFTHSIIHRNWQEWQE